MYFAWVKVGMTSAFYDILKTEWSHQVCAIQKLPRIFSTKLQFGTIKTNIFKELILRKRENLWCRFSHSSLNVYFSRSSKYMKNELLAQTLGVPNKVDKLTCPSITFK